MFIEANTSKSFLPFDMSISSPENLHSQHFSNDTVSALAEISTNAPFRGLVICVTGMSKEGRIQVMNATQRLGGKYSPNLHPHCTHLVVLRYRGRKVEHGLKYGSRNGLFVVTFRWFADCVARNVRLQESPYCLHNSAELRLGLGGLIPFNDINTAGNICEPVENLNICNGVDGLHTVSRRGKPPLFGDSMYVDVDIPHELRCKVLKAASEEGVSCLDRWYVGCNANYVVCERDTIQKYIGQSNNIVSPQWVLKTFEEMCAQKLVKLSADLFRQLGTMLNDTKAVSALGSTSHEDRQKIVKLAKNRVRSRRGQLLQRRMSAYPVTPKVVLDSISWTISEPTSTAAMYRDTENVEEIGGFIESTCVDSENCEDSMKLLGNISSEKGDIVFQEQFLTILFPVDQFAELGLSSRTFYSEKGFSCLQVLDSINAFYQENMAMSEVECAIHTDSKFADNLRRIYASEETTGHDCVAFRRVDLLGSRRSFEMLRRVNAEHCGNVYELLIRA